MTWYQFFQWIITGFAFGLGFALSNAVLAWLGGLISAARTGR